MDASLAAFNKVNKLESNGSVSPETAELTRGKILGKRLRTLTRQNKIEEAKKAELEDELDTLAADIKELKENLAKAEKMREEEKQRHRRIQQPHEWPSEPQEAPKKPQSHDPLALPTYYEFSKSFACA